MVEVYSSKELDPQKRAAGDLELVIKDEIAEERPAEALVSVEEERQSERVTTVSERTAARLLIYTTNTTMFVKGSELLSRIQDISTLFAEVHVVVLNIATKGVFEAERLSDNVWVYPTNSRHGLDTIRDAQTMVSEQLEFAGGFRADIVIALDPFAAGVAAAQAAKKYDRPLQVHITNDVYDRQYLKQLSHSFFKRLCMRYVFGQRPSVRASTRAIAKSLLSHHPKLAETMEVVPQHIDLSHIVNAEPSGVLNQRFPQYNFFILFVGPVTAEGGALEALEAAADLLRYPTIALMYLGEGDVKKEIEKRATAMGVIEQVIVSPKDIDTVAAMLEAQILVFPDGKDADERILLEAAAAGLPIIASDSDFVRELLIDGESAFICPSGDIQCMQDRANVLLNENSYRTKFARNAREDVLERVEQNVDEYRYAFKDSVERVLYGSETITSGEEVIDENEEVTEETT